MTRFVVLSLTLCGAVLFSANSASAQFSFPKIPRPKLPSIPRPKLPKIPRPKFPKIPRPKFDPSIELWGKAGAYGYPQAARIMRSRYAWKRPQRLPRREHQALRRYFGRTLDRVSIFWGAQPLNEWGHGRYKVKLAGERAAAQTFGYAIYVRYPMHRMTPRSRVRLLAHELQHVRQYERFGHSLKRFGYEYFKGYKKAGLNYHRTPLEVEADRLERQLASRLAAAVR